MDVFYAYTYSTGAWLGLQGVALMAMPRIIATMLLDETRPPTSVEMYFARSLGFSLLTIGILTVLLSGSIPLTANLADPVSTDENDPKAPYAVPVMVITSIFHAISAFYAYTAYLVSPQTALAVGMVGYGAIAAMGLWCGLFASSKGRISRKTGADKRTSAFPFKNVEADKRFPEKKRM